MTSTKVNKHNNISIPFIECLCYSLFDFYIIYLLKVSFTHSKYNKKITKPKVNCILYTPEWKKSN